MAKPFSRRMWSAVAFIESGRECQRQLDDAFESFDGHAMSAALWTLAEKRPQLKANLPKYVTPASAFPESAALVGKPLAEIRKAAKRMREAAAEALFPRENSRPGDPE